MSSASFNDMNPPTPNTSKNRKKKQKQKAKKLAASSNTTSGVSSPSLTDNDLIKEESATAAALPAPPIVSGATSIPPPTLAHLGSESPSTPLDTPTSEIPAGGPVGVGAAGAGITSAAVTARAQKALSIVGTDKSEHEPLPLSDNVKKCIQAVVSTGKMDVVGIARGISKNIDAGDYKAPAALPSTASGPPFSTAAKPAPTALNASAPPAATPASVTTQPVTTAQPVPAPRSGSNTITPIAKDDVTNHSKTDTLKKAAAGASAAVAGAGAAVAGIVHKDKTSTAKSGVQTTSGGVSSVGTTTLSESVKHCIDSAVKAPSVDVYEILKHNVNKSTLAPTGNNAPITNAPPKDTVKLPEPAVGGSTQTMPSSTKGADPPAVLKKIKENRKLNSLKKKNCIIL